MDCFQHLIFHFLICRAVSQKLPQIHACFILKAGFQIALRRQTDPVARTAELMRQGVYKPDPPFEARETHIDCRSVSTILRTQTGAPEPFFQKAPDPASTDHTEILSQADRHHFNETDIQFPVFCQRCQPDDIFRRRLLHRDAVDSDSQPCTGQRRLKTCKRVFKAAAPGDLLIPVRVRAVDTDIDRIKSIRN